MKNYLLALSILICGIVNAQYIPYGCDSKQVKSLQGATLYVIQTGDKVFDDSLSSAVEKYWKVTPYKVIPADETMKYLKDENNWFIAAATSLSKNSTNIVASPLTFKSDPSMGFYCNTIFVFHGSSDNRSLKKMDFAIDVTRSELPFWDNKLSATTVALAVKNLNDNVDIVIKNKVEKTFMDSKGDNKRIPQILYDEFNKNPGALKTKTLLIDSSRATKYNKGKIITEFKAYKYKYRFLSTTQMNVLLNSADSKNYCVLATVSFHEIGGLQIYDFETKCKIWSGQQDDMPKELTLLNEAIAKSK